MAEALERFGAFDPLPVDFFLVPFRRIKNIPLDLLKKIFNNLSLYTYIDNNIIIKVLAPLLGFQTSCVIYQTLVDR